MKPSAGHKPEPNTLQLIFYAAVSAGLILAPNAAAILSLPIAILLCNRPAAGGANAPAYWAPASLIRPTPKKTPAA